MESVNQNEKSVITEQTLSLFSGSEEFYRHSLAKNVIFTEGCAYLCENGAAWLIDAVAIAQCSRRVAAEEFQSWKLSVDKNGRSAMLTATDGGAREDEEGQPIYKELYRQKIPYTDFPLSEIKLYCCANGPANNGKTIMLVSEY